MTKNTNGNGGLSLAIIFAGLVIGGSVIFFGLQSKSSGGDGDMDSAIEKGIEKFIEKQQVDAQKAQMDAENQQRTVAVENLKKPTAADHIRGEKDAVLTVIEYSDFECGYCKRFHGTMIETLANYKGKVNWIYRHFPIKGGSSTNKAEGAECVADLNGAEKYWEFVDAALKAPKLDASGVADLAAELGSNRADIKACLDSGKFTARVKADMAEGTKAGVRGTPGSFVLNNKTGAVQVVPGAVPIDHMKTIIDSMLK